MTNNRIQTAIEDSIREDTVATLEATVDTQEWVDLVNGLDAVADGWVEREDFRTGHEGQSVREYWGTDEDGDDWRVHVQSAA